MSDVQTSRPASDRADQAAGGPDTSDYAAVHTSIRRAGYALAAAAPTLRPLDHARMDAFVTYWKGHAGEILSHHGVEDTIFFPALRERAPHVGGVLDQLDDEHHLLDRLMEDARRAIADVVTGAAPDEAAAVLQQLADVMDDHLDLEDREIIPQFVEHFDGEEYEALTKAAMKQVGLGKQAAFTVPYIGYWSDPDDRAALLGTAPLPFRVLYRLTRRRHGRLTERALGAEAIARAMA